MCAKVRKPITFDCSSKFFNIKTNIAKTTRTVFEINMSHSQTEDALFEDQTLQKMFCGINLSQSGP